MLVGARTFTRPRWKLTRWLVYAGPGVPDDLRQSLLASLFGTLPIFAGGVLNSILVAGIIAFRAPEPPFLIWIALEVALGVIRLAVLMTAYRNSAEGRPTPTDLYLVLALCWAASVGYGTFISVLSGDWLVATLACMSAAGMVGGICLRNFGAPRLAGVMIAISLGPCCLAAPFSGEPLMLITLLQIPFYLASMQRAAYRLNGLLVSTMQAEREHERKALHDALTGLANRSGLDNALSATGQQSEDRSTALLYLDLDGFKSVNDTHGHAAGDHLLKMAADRLRGSLRAGDIAARIGGDEFVVVARDVDASQMGRFGERLIREIAAPYELGSGVTANVGASVGVALTPLHGKHLADLMGVADRALYEAKLGGKSRCVVAGATPGPQVTT
jgi:diguanylate cyclase (GGDEF)-like protein